MTIFKAYDIRGRYPEEINEELAHAIGRAFVTFTKCSDVMVGYDARTHSPALTEALIRGLTEQGASVTNCGLVTTPQTIAMHLIKGHECAIMVTASHLDAPMNGFKMFTQSGKNITSLYGMLEMERLVATKAFTPSVHIGTVRHANYTEDFATAINTLAPKHTGQRKRFVVDCSNGSVGALVKLHQRLLNLDITIINAEPDGTFPNHSPNPIAPGAERQAAECIQQTGAAGGCIFDADADRVTFLDEQGIPIHPNATSCLIITELLKRHPKRTIAYDLISSRVLPETIKHLHGTPLRTRVGRNILVDDMRREHALFGAESSSHMIYGDLAYADAATLSMLIMFSIVEREERPLSTYSHSLLKYPLQPEKNYNIDKPQTVIDALPALFPEAKVDRLDGLALLFPDGWIVVRPSNTEPLLRFRAEANTVERLHEFVHAVDALVKKLGGGVETSSH